VKTRFLDSWAILEWISGRQPGTAMVAKRLSGAEEGRRRLFLSAINTREVYAFLRRQQSEALALARRESSGTFPVTGAVATAEDIWNAAELKGRFPTGFTGAFAAA
jgi:predicted nucleic acid-binding protein